MSFFKKRLYFLTGILATIFFSSQAFSQGQKLRIVYYNAYPHMFKTKDKAIGPGIKFIETILSNAHIDHSFSHLPIKRALGELEKNRIDVLMALLKTPERMEKFNFGSVPIVSATPCLITNDSAIKTRDRILKEGGKLMLPNDFILERVVKESLKNFNVTYIHGINPIKKMFNLLNYRKNVYGLIQVCLPSVYEVDGVRAIELVESRMDFYLAFSKHVDKKIIRQIDDEIRKMNLKGQGYYEFLKKYKIDKMKSSH